jgi:hypothetical protein
MIQNHKFQSSSFYLQVLIQSNKWKKLSKKKEIDSEFNQANPSLIFPLVKVKMKLLEEELRKVINRDIGLCYKTFI